VTTAEPSNTDPTRVAITELTEVQDMVLGLMWRLDVQRHRYVPVHVAQDKAPWWQLPLEDIRAELSQRLARLTNPT
jgi:hypothetical protein